MKVLAFGASNSKSSINAQFAAYAADQINGSDVNKIDLNDFEMPIYSIDRENSKGIPSKAKEFTQLISDAELIVISFAEHNGSYTAAFKNILDWVSRHNNKAWSGKDLFLLATSPGGRGGMGVLSMAVNSFPHFGANVKASFSLPAFQENFDNKITDPELEAKFKEELQKL